MGSQFMGTEFIEVHFILKNLHTLHAYIGDTETWGERRRHREGGREREKERKRELVFGIPPWLSAPLSS